MDSHFPYRSAVLGPAHHFAGVQEGGPGPAAHAGPGFSVQALGVDYGSRSVLSQLHLAPVAPGQVVGVLGPNGVGKSTLMRALARLLPAHGQARLGTVDLLDCPRPQHLQRVAYLPQVLPQLSSLRVLETLNGALRATCPGLPAAEREARLQAVLARLQLHALAMQRMDRLSGGQRQMVGLAQVLVRQTPLLLLDEPTSALDLRWQVLALETVRQVAREHAAIACIALHDLNLAARFCDRLVLLGRQGVLAEGTPGEVLRPALLRQAYGVEARVEFTTRQDCVVVVERACAVEDGAAARR